VSEPLVVGARGARVPQRASFKERHYPETRFGGFTDVDGTIAFYTRVHSLLTESSIVLDVGSGRGAYADDNVPVRKNLRILKGKVARVIGLDVDPAAQSNPFQDEFRLLKNSVWPVEDASIDLCLSDYVLEHIEHPESFFENCRRVLKNGGYLCIRTPNAWSYVAWFSKLVPDRLHSRVLARVQEERKEEDVFPTHYRCNSLPRLRRMLDRYGFEHVVYGYEAEPSYLEFSALAYALGALHQRFAPRFLRPAMHAFARVRKLPATVETLKSDA
jgi:SAM-dependent methyltransferase